MHVIHVTWNDGEDDSTVKETVGCLVASCKEELLLSSTYDGSIDMFPVVFSIPNKKILDMRTLCVIEED